MSEPKQKTDWDTDEDAPHKPDEVTSPTGKGEPEADAGGQEGRTETGKSDQDDDELGEVKGTAELSKREQAQAKAAQTVDPIVPRSEVDIMRSLFHLAEQIKDTEFVPTGLRGSTPKVLSAILTGREIGLGPMTSLRNIYVIDGKPDFSAALQLAIIRREGHSVTGSADAEKAEVVGERADNHDRLEVVYTMERAKQAGLANKQNYQRHPEAMLWARAITELADRLFSDVFAGTSLTEAAQELSQDG